MKVEKLNEEELRLLGSRLKQVINYTDFTNHQDYNDTLLDVYDLVEELATIFHSKHEALLVSEQQ